MDTILPLRLPYNSSDIIFYILNKPLVTEQNITVQLEGEAYKLSKNMGRWGALEEIMADRDLLATGDLIALRYRYRM